MPDLATRVLDAIRKAESGLAQDRMLVDAYQQTLNDRYLSTTQNRNVLAAQDEIHARQLAAVKRIAKRLGVSTDA